MKKLLQIGALALFIAISVVACTKDNSSAPAKKATITTFIHRDTITPHSAIAVRDTITPKKKP